MNLSNGSGTPKAYDVAKLPYLVHVMVCSTAADFESASNEEKPIPITEIPNSLEVSSDAKTSKSKDHS